MAFEICQHAACAQVPEAQRPIRRLSNQAVPVGVNRNAEDLRIQVQSADHAAARQVPDLDLPGSRVRHQARTITGKRDAYDGDTELEGGALPQRFGLPNLYVAIRTSRHKQLAVR